MFPDKTLPPIDPSLSVNEVLRRWPSAVSVLNAFGIDTCCGGTLPLATAALHAGIPVGEVIAAIGVAATRRSAEAPARSAR